MRRLTSSEKAQLKGLAHGLKPRVQVGRNGVTEGVLGEVRRALDSHELIKVKFLEHKDRKVELSQRIAEDTGSGLVSNIGNTAIFYRESPDPVGKKIKLS